MRRCYTAIRDLFTIRPCRSAGRAGGPSGATPLRSGRRPPAGVPFAYRVYWLSHSGHSDHSSQGTAPLASARHPILTKPRRSSSVQVPKSTTVPQSCRIAAGLMLPKASRQSSYISGLYTVETSPGLASPLNPATPCGPTEPCKPAGPCGPTEPCKPAGPCKPTGPLGPSGPVCPSAVGWHAMAPVITTARINSNALEAFMFLPPLFLQLLSSLLRGTPRKQTTPLQVLSHSRHSWPPGRGLKGRTGAHPSLKNPYPTGSANCLARTRSTRSRRGAAVSG